jgi:hypothetical protein
MSSCSASTEISLDPSKKRKRTRRKITILSTQAALTATMEKANARVLRRRNQATKRSRTTTKSWDSRWPTAKLGRRPCKENVLIAG